MDGQDDIDHRWLQTVGVELASGLFNCTKMETSNSVDGRTQAEYADSDHVLRFHLPAFRGQALSATRQFSPTRQHRTTAEGFLQSTRMTQFISTSSVQILDFTQPETEAGRSGPLAAESHAGHRSCCNVHPDRAGYTDSPGCS